MTTRRSEMVETYKRPEKLKDELTISEEAMNFYNSRYFVINMTSLKLIGLWPYQNKIQKIFLRTSIFMLIFIAMIPQFISAFVNKNNVPRLIQAIGTLTYMFSIMVKFLGMIVTEKKLKNLYENIVRNWNMLENESEKQILEESSEMGRILTIVYIGYMIQAGFLFLAVPLGHKTFDLIWPLKNGTRPQLFVLDGEYLVDREEYYFQICAFEVSNVFGTVPLFTTIDSTYATCVQQCVGLFNVVKMRLELSTKQKQKFRSTVHPLHDPAHHAIVKSTELHEKVLNFGQVLESSYSGSMLFVILGNVLVLATASVNILFNLGDPILLLRFILIIVGLTIHMFYLSWPGQKMINGSNDVFYAAYNNEWYQCSTESQKLLLFIMQRAEEPSYLTAGGFYILNFENFESLFKTSVSYITVLASFDS